MACVAVVRTSQSVRGGVKIENRENLGQCPNTGGGGVVKKQTEMCQFQFGNFENRGVGGLYFSKMSQFQLFDSVFCNIAFIRNV